MKQKSVGLTLRATILALALILVAGSPALPPFDGVAYAQDDEVTDLSWSALPNGTLQLEWDEVVGADSYRLWKGEGSGQSVSWGEEVHMTLDAPTVSYVDSAVTAGMTYSYVIEIYDGDTRLGWSDVENVTMPGGTQKPTAQPTVTLAADGLTAITVTWTEVAGADNYRVRYWTSGLSGWMDLATQETGRTVSHTGLTSGRQYFYIVRGQNAGGNGPYSGSPGNYDSLTLEATDPKPVLTLTHPERLRVELSWTRVSADATYQVQRMRTVTISGSVDADAAEDWADLGAAQSGNTYVDTTVTNASPDGDNNPANDSTVYSYRVQATENGIQGDPSDVKMATIPATDALPPTPPGLSATPISSSRINVTWSASSGATSYQLRYKMGDGNYGNPMNMMAKMAYLHTGLNAATEYSYQVRAVNVNGHSDWSSAESATTVAATTAAGRLGVPMGLRVVDATTTADPPVSGLKVTWNAVAKATGYELRKWSGTAWAEVSLSEEEQTMRSKTDADGLDAGTTYYYIIAALDDNGTTPETDDDMSDWSAPQSGMTDAVKPTTAPAGLLATPRGENRIWVSWTGMDEATEYVLQWRRKGTSAWSTINVQGRMTHAHTGLSAGMQYQYRIAAKNSGGMSPWSDEMSGTTWSRQLSTPTGLMAVDATDGATPQIKLTWNAVSGATGYDIQKWNVTNNAWRELGGTDDPMATPAMMGKTSHTDTAVMAGMTYYYIVRATSGDVMSPWTGAMSGMTKATVPGAPTLVLVSTGQTMVRLSWAAATDTSGYTGWEMQYFEGTASGDELDREAFQKMEMSLNAMPMHHIQSNLKPGTRYSFRIRGTLPLGVKSTFSEVKQIITKPANPTLMASSATSTTINLTWTIVTPDGLADADGGTSFDCEDYEIQRRKTGESMWVNVDDTRSLASGKCSITDDGEVGDSDGLDSGTLYYYRLRVAVEVTDPSGHLPATIKSYWDQDNARTPSQ